MNTNKIKGFAEFARSEADKTGAKPDAAKQGYINMLKNGYCRKNGIPHSFDDSIIPQHIKNRFSDEIASSEDFDVHSIGTLYQHFINADRKSTVDAISGLEIKSNQISKSTQVFTPGWIVKYLVDNSLGKYAKEHVPGTYVDKQLKYYIQDGTKFCGDQRQIEEITFLDPCCGCGNILIYAFDVFMKLYESCGTEKKKAAQLILKNNIFGADIDQTSAQTTKFLLLAKAYQFNKDIFDTGIEPNIYVTGAKDGIGSLKDIPGNRQKFHIVCTNPPYLKRMSRPLKDYLNKNIKPYSKDLFTAFMYRGMEYTKQDGYMAYMTPNVWMYLSSHKNIRQYMLGKKICSLIELQKGSYFTEASVDICAFCVKNSTSGSGMYIKLNSLQNTLEGQQQAFEKAVDDINQSKANSSVFIKSSKDFEKIPDMLMLYHAPEVAIENLGKNTIGHTFTVKQGMTTGNNKRFLRYWWEVPYDEIGFGYQSCEAAAKSGKKWFPYNKGGKYRKWYGNNEYVVMYQNDGEEMKEYTSHLPQGTWVRLKSREYYFKPSVTWSFISSTRFGVRYSPAGSIFDVAGSSLFADEFEYVLGFLGSSTAFYLLQLINPSMNYQIRDIKALPYIEHQNAKAQVTQLVEKCIEISENNWDSFEISYNFTHNPLIKDFSGQPLKNAVKGYLQQCIRQQQELAQCETQINKIFAGLYNMESFICCEVSPDEVTLTPQNEKSIVEDLLSYILGVALGRFTKDGKIQNFKKSIPMSELCSCAHNMLCRYFKNCDTEYIANVLSIPQQNVLEEYYQKHFIKYHTKKYKNKPIYRLGNNKIWL